LAQNYFIAIALPGVYQFQGNGRKNGDGGMGYGNGDLKGGRISEDIR
jgi:hypothetical protein